MWSEYARFKGAFEFRAIRAGPGLPSTAQTRVSLAAIPGFCLEVGSHPIKPLNGIDEKRSKPKSVSLTISARVEQCLQTPASE